jgi:propane 2-monooxygenase small subunit
MLADDAEHGAANQEVMNGWLATYTPMAVEAARNLQPIWSQLSEKVVRFEDSWDRSRERFDGLTSEIGISAPKEVPA